MYADTCSSKKLGSLSAQLLNLLTELGSRRSKQKEKVFVRPADFACYKSLKSFLGAK